MAHKSTATARRNASAIAIYFALAILSAPAAAQDDGDPFDANLKQLQAELNDKAQKCLPIDTTAYQDLYYESQRRYNLWMKALKKGAPVEGDKLKKLGAQREAADALWKAAKAAKAAQEACKPPQPAEKPKEPDAKGGQPAAAGVGPAPTAGQTAAVTAGTSGTASAQFTHASKIYEAAKGKCDAANMMAARAQMDAAIALQRAALDGAMKAGATAIAEKLKAELKTMEDQYWSVDSSIRKCAPQQAGGTSSILDMFPEKRPMNPVAVGIIAGQAGQENSPQAGPMTGNWTGMIPVNGPSMGPEMNGVYDPGMKPLGPAGSPSEMAALGNVDKYALDYSGLRGLEAEGIGKDFDRFMRTIDPYGDAGEKVENPFNFGVDVSFDGAKLGSYGDTAIAAPELPWNVYTPRPINIDPDQLPTADIDLYPNAPVYLGVGPPKQPDCGGSIEPGMCEDTQGCDWLSSPAGGGERCTFTELGLNAVTNGTSTDVVANPDGPEMPIPPGPTMTPVDSESKLELGGGAIPVDSKPTDPGFTVGNGIEGKIGEGGQEARLASSETGSSSVYGPPPTAEEKIENASRQYLEARRHCNQFDMRLAQVKLEAVYESQGYSKKAAKKAADAKLEQEWKEFSTEYPDACLPESLAPKKG